MLSRFLRAQTVPLAQVCLIAALLTAPHASAQESTTELAFGGLVAGKAAEGGVVVDSADISISPDTVVARYKLVNPGPTPVTLTLTFPVPDLDFSDPDVAYAIPGSDPVNFMGLTTKIAGKPGAFSVTQSAVLNGKDISGELRRNKLAMVPIGTFQNSVAAMPEKQREALAEAGLLVQSGNDANGNALYFPTWTVRTSASKSYLFPPSQPVDIELRYRTSVGMSLDTPLRLPLRNERNLASQVQKERTAFCIDDGFYAGLDKIGTVAPPSPGLPPLSNEAGVRPGAPEANTFKLRERRIIFAMKGRASPGLVKNFRLVVDKGRPDRVVSFCLDNLKRISPTAFEMRATDFTPTADLKVLFIGRN